MFATTNVDFRQRFRYDSVSARVAEIYVRTSTLGGVQPRLVFAVCFLNIPSCLSAAVLIVVSGRSSVCPLPRRVIQPLREM